jgi:sulfatase modifying factor 1
MNDSAPTVGESNARTIGTRSRIDPKLWEDLYGRGLVTVLNQFMTRFRLSARDIADLAQVGRANLWSAVYEGRFTQDHVARLLVQVQKRQGMPRSEYHTWRKGLYLAAFLNCRRHTGPKKRRFIWDMRLTKGLYRAISQAYDETDGFTVRSKLSLADFAEAWEKQWAWIKVPNRYRVTRVEKYGYDLRSTLPLAVTIGKFPDLGPGLRAESKGWLTGAYRVYRISTRPLGDPRDFEPELVHIPAGKFWMCEQVRPAVCAESLRLELSHKVDLDGYWIGRYPVTVAQFAFFVAHCGYFTTEEEQHGSDSISWRQPTHGEHRDLQEYGRHPVTMVSKADAQAYCRWLSEVTGRTYDLPTRKQWEKAAFGTDARKHPWGNSEPNRTLCNIEHWCGATTPVGQFSPAGDGPKFDNAFGCADMVGNVSEWTLDTHRSTRKIHPDCDPDFYYYKTETCHVLCGTSWRMGRQSRSDRRGYRDARDDVGFRVVAHPSAKLDSASH